MKQILNLIIEPYKNFPLKKILNILFWSFKLYLLVLVPYLTAITAGVLLSILFGGFMDFISNAPDFTRAYFYDGHLFELIAWRIHLTWFVLCFLVMFNEELT